MVWTTAPISIRGPAGLSCPSVQTMTAVGASKKRNPRASHWERFSRFFAVLALDVHQTKDLPGQRHLALPKNAFPWPTGDRMLRPGRFAGRQQGEVLSFQPFQRRSAEHEKFPGLGVHGRGRPNGGLEYILQDFSWDGVGSEGPNALAGVDGIQKIHKRIPPF
jgi:hypothetical protein